jgi:hypothetical protein
MAAAAVKDSGRLRQMSTSRIGLCLFLLALGFVLLGPLARATGPDSIFLRFEMFGGPGRHFLTLRATVEQSSDH